MRKRKVIILKKSPLFTLIVKMVVTVFYNQFNSYAVIQNNVNIMNCRNIHCGYSTTHDFFSVFLYKKPFIIIIIHFAIPILVIQGCYKNVIFANNTGER